jgi:hypothetical protein
MERAMTDLANDLRKRFDWAMYESLEAYVVLPDGKSYERSDIDERAIGLFENLFDSVDLIPPSLIQAAEAIRAAEPELFEKSLEQGMEAVRLNGSPSRATEFVEILTATTKGGSVGSHGRHASSC